MSYLILFGTIQRNLNGFSFNIIQQDNSYPLETDITIIEMALFHRSSYTFNYIKTGIQHPGLSNSQDSQDKNSIQSMCASAFREWNIDTYNHCVILLKITDSTHHDFVNMYLVESKYIVPNLPLYKENILITLDNQPIYSDESNDFPMFIKKTNAILTCPTAYVLKNYLDGRPSEKGYVNQILK
jgi:hypothetical protein